MKGSLSVVGRFCLYNRICQGRKNVSTNELARKIQRDVTHVSLAIYGLQREILNSLDSILETLYSSERASKYKALIQ